MIILIITIILEIVVVVISFLFLAIANYSTFDFFGWMRGGLDIYFCKWIMLAVNIFVFFIEILITYHSWDLKTTNVIYKYYKLLILITMKLLFCFVSFIAINKEVVWYLVISYIIGISAFLLAIFFSKVFADVCIKSIKTKRTVLIILTFLCLGFSIINVIIYALSDSGTTIKSVIWAYEKMFALVVLCPSLLITFLLKTITLEKSILSEHLDISLFFAYSINLFNCSFALFYYY